MEVEKYLLYEKASREADPVKWWFDYKALLPCLAVLARKFLSCPPSSVESERVFSVGGS